MRLRFWHIALVFLAVASCTGPRTIPRDKLGDIFHDMFLQDQQIKNDFSLKRIADTSLVYQGIFKEYGYDTDDYLYTINKYIKDPEKLSKVFEKVAERLLEESKDIRKEKDFLEWRTRFLAIYKHRIDTTSLPRVPHSAQIGVFAGFENRETDETGLWYVSRDCHVISGHENVGKRGRS